MSNGTPRFLFHSDAVADETFIILEFTGLEAMSSPYSFEIQLLTQKKPESIKLENLIANTAYLAVKYSVPLKDGSQGTKTLKIHGMLSEFELMDKMNEYVRYRAVLVPRLWKLSLTEQSRAFQDVDVKKTVEAVLMDKASHKFTSEDYDLKLNSSYPQSDFVVQYNETDLDFISRWLEHEGIFYYFDQTESGEKAVFCDAPEAYLPSFGQVRYKPEGIDRSGDSDREGEGTWTEETLQTFRCRMSRLSKSVKLKDYNYRTPSVDDKAECEVKDSKGEGNVYEYGEHFKSPADGKALAQVRAEAIKCREKVFEGAGTVRPFRPGLVFTLSDHFHPDLNRDYVIVSVRHHMKRELSIGGALSSAVEYRNEFECIPSDLVFRPERKTPWPRIHGFMNAVVDAAGDGKYAEIDDQGRYKVKFPWDLSDKKDGKASRYVRMGQPYAGAGMGMHFPLHKGTEVLVSFIDGDPDRPVIASAVPNPQTTSMVVAQNQTQCDLKSGGNNEIRFEDQEGSEQVYIHAQKDRLTVVENDESKKVKHDQKIEVTNDRSKTVSGNQSEHVVKDKTINIDQNHTETVTQNMSVTVGQNDSLSVGQNRTIKVGVNQSATIGANKSDTIGVNSAETIGVAKALTIGAAYQVTVGAAMNETIGAAKAMEIGADYVQSVGANKQVTVGGDVTEAFAKNHSETTSENFSLVVKKEIGIEAKESLSIRCGKASIVLKKDGTILIEGKDLTVKGSGEIVAEASKDMTLKGKNILQN